MGDNEVQPGMELETQSAATAPSTALSFLLGDTQGERAMAAFLRTADENKLSAEVAFFAQAIKKNPKIRDCDKGTIAEAFVNVAACGTTLNPKIGHAFLVPRKEEGVLRCCLDFSYRGLSDQVTKGGNVTHVNAVVVYDCDTFEHIEGTERRIHHVPLSSKINPTDEERRILNEVAKSPWPHIVAVYSLAYIRGAHSPDFIVLPRWKIEKAKASSRGGGVWGKYPEEQVRKTGIRYHSKTLPLSPSAMVAVSLSHELDGLDLERTAPKEDRTARFTHDEERDEQGDYTWESGKPHA